MVDSLSCFCFHKWCNKCLCIYCPACGVVHVQDSLLLMGINSPLSGRRWVSSLLSEWSFTIYTTSHNRKSDLLSEALDISFFLSIYHLNFYFRILTKLLFLSFVSYKYLCMTPNSRSNFRAGVSINTHSLILSPIELLGMINVSSKVGRGL